MWGLWCALCSLCVVCFVHVFVCDVCECVLCSLYVFVWYVSLCVARERVSVCLRCRGRQWEGRDAEDPRLAPGGIPAFLQASQLVDVLARGH